MTKVTSKRKQSTENILRVQRVSPCPSAGRLDTGAYVGTRRKRLSLARAFKASKPTPDGTPCPTRPHLLFLPETVPSTRE